MESITEMIARRSAAIRREVEAEYAGHLAQSLERAFRQVQQQLGVRRFPPKAAGRRPPRKAPVRVRIEAEAIEPAPKRPPRPPKPAPVVMAAAPPAPPAPPSGARPKHPPADARVWGLYEGGKTTDQITAEIGVSRAAVLAALWRCRQRLGIPIPPRPKKRVVARPPAPPVPAGAAPPSRSPDACKGDVADLVRDGITEPGPIAQRLGISRAAAVIALRRIRGHVVTPPPAPPPARAPDLAERRAELAAIAELAGDSGGAPVPVPVFVAEPEDAQEETPPPAPAQAKRRGGRKPHVPNESTKVALRTTPAPDGHTHVATFHSESGLGSTDVAQDGHWHPIQDFEIQRWRGHTHETTAERVANGAE
jgi:hypothetical protein